MKNLKVEINFKVPDDYDIYEAKELIYHMISDCAWDQIHEMKFKVIDFFLSECKKKEGFIFFGSEESNENYCGRQQRF